MRRCQDPFWGRDWKEKKMFRAQLFVSCQSAKLYTFCFLSSFFQKGSYHFHTFVLRFFHPGSSTHPHFSSYSLGEWLKVTRNTQLENFAQSFDESFVLSGLSSISRVWYRQLMSRQVKSSVYFKNPDGSTRNNKGKQNTSHLQLPDIIISIVVPSLIVYKFKNIK